MRELLLITNALSDVTRVRLLMMLSERELCVCQLVSSIGLADSTVSKHMSLLRAAGLVTSRKQGRWVYYRSGCDQSSVFSKRVLQLLQEYLQGDPVTAADAERLRMLIAQDDGTICQTADIPCSKHIRAPLEKV